MKKLELYFKYKEELESELSFNVNEYAQKKTKEENKDLFIIAIPIGFVVILFLCISILSDDGFLYIFLLNGIYIPIILIINKYITRKTRKNDEYQKALCEYISINFDEKQISRLLSLKTKKNIEKYIKDNKSEYEFEITSYYSGSNLDINLSKYANELVEIVSTNIFEIFGLDELLINNSKEKNKYLNLSKKVINYIFINKIFINLKYLSRYDYNISYSVFLSEKSFYESYNIDINDIKKTIEELTRYIYNNREEMMDNLLFISHTAYGNVEDFTDFILSHLRMKEENDNQLNKRFPLKGDNEKERIAYFLVLNQLILNFISDYIKQRLVNILNAKEKEKEFKRLFDLASYQNHCWHCHTSLSSNTNKRCPVCGWYICNDCGACSIHPNHIS